MVKNFLIDSIADLSLVIEDLKNQLTQDSIVLFYGGMSAGKTTFISHLLKTYNIDFVSSPTYAIHQKYENFHHLDLYRINSSDELEATGFWDLFINNNTNNISNSNQIFLIEWAEKINIDELPMNYKIIKLQLEKIQNDENKTVRKITLSF